MPGPWDSPAVSSRSRRSLIGRPPRDARRGRPRRWGRRPRRTQGRRCRRSRRRRSAPRWRRPSRCGGRQRSRSAASRGDPPARTRQPSGAPPRRTPMAAQVRHDEGDAVRLLDAQLRRRRAARCGPSAAAMATARSGSSSMRSATRSPLDPDGAQSSAAADGDVARPARVRRHRRPQVHLDVGAHLAQHLDDARRARVEADVPERDRARPGGCAPATSQEAAEEMSPGTRCLARQTRPGPSIVVIRPSRSTGAPSQASMPLGVVARGPGHGDRRRAIGGEPGEHERAEHLGARDGQRRGGAPATGRRPVTRSGA